MATTKGREAVRNYIAQAPGQVAAKLLVGAARAGATVIADEAKERSGSAIVSENITVKVRNQGSRIVARIGVKDGWARSLGIWAEYGTSPHFISVDDEQRGGRSAGRINRLDRSAEQQGQAGPGHALRIGGNFIAGTVRHPGARPHPFLRVSLDLKEAEAFAAAQSYINVNASKLRLGGGTDEAVDP